MLHQRLRILFGYLHLLYARVFAFVLPSTFHDTFRPIRHKLHKDRDFGRYIDKGPQALKVPQSINELERIVAQAFQEKQRLNICGSAHSSNGLTLSARSGFRLFLRELPVFFKMVTPDIVECSATATVEQIGKFLAQHKKMLPVLGDQLDLTLGGYLSAGGIGYNSVEFGFLSDHVESLELLTLTNGRLSCSKKKNPEIFHSVLGGQGQLGIILSAQIRVIDRKQVFLRSEIYILPAPSGLIDAIEHSFRLDFNYHFLTLIISKNRPFLVNICGKNKSDKSDLRSFNKTFNYIQGEKVFGISQLVRCKLNRFTLPGGYNLQAELTDFWLWSEYCVSFSAFKELFEELVEIAKIDQSWLHVYPIRLAQGTSEYHSFLPYPEPCAEEEKQVVFGLAFTFHKKSQKDVTRIKDRLASLFERVTKLGGKPYYHGYHPKAANKTLQQIYPMFDDFLELKKKLDPDNLLNSDWLTKPQ